MMMFLQAAPILSHRKCVGTGQLGQNIKQITLEVLCNSIYRKNRFKVVIDGRIVVTLRLLSPYQSKSLSFVKLQTHENYVFVNFMHLNFHSSQTALIQKLCCIFLMKILIMIILEGLTLMKEEICSSTHRIINISSASKIARNFVIKYHSCNQHNLQSKIHFFY